MNLVFHHFRKEARFLRVRWLLWLALLVLLLLVELEWVSPMVRRFHAADPSFINQLRWIVRAFALWLAASSVPEDVPGSPSRFLAARPLPLAAYLAARGLTFLALVVAPLSVWEGLYLAFSGRPLSEVLLGAGEAAVVSTLLYGWVLPFSLVWRGIGQWWIALGVIYISADVASYLNDNVFWRFRLPVLMGSTSSGRASYPTEEHLQTLVVLFLAAVILWVAAWRHVRAAWLLRSRMVLAAVLGVMAGWCWWGYSVTIVQVSGASAQDEVNALASGLSPQLDASLSFHHESIVPPFQSRRTVYSAEANLNLRSADIPNVTLHWRSLGSDLTWQGESRSSLLQVMPAAEFASNWTLQIYEAPRTVAALFPQGTLLRWHEKTNYASDLGNVFLAPDSWTPDAPGKPTLRGTLEACWVRWTLAGEIPLAQGGVVDLGDCRWEILEVRPHANEKGSTQQGAIAVNLRVEHREILRDGSPWHWQAAFVPMIHSPSQDIVWASQTHMETQNSGHVPMPPEAERGKNSGWVRTQYVFSWPAVLEPGSRPDADKLSDLQLSVVRRQFMGTSRWQYETEGVTIKENRVPLYASESMQDDAAVAARIARLPDLPEGATEKQAAELVASVLEAVPQGGGNIALAVEKLRPVARQHPGVLLKLDVYHEWLTILTTLANEMGEDQRDAIIDQLPRSSWLAPVVLKRGWDDAARRAADKLLAAPSLPNGVGPLFWKWRDPAHFPALVRHIRRDPSYRRFMELAKYPGSEPALHECTEHWMANTLPVVEQWLRDQDTQLLCGLADGNTEALGVLLHLSRSISAAERRNAANWIMESVAPRFGVSGPPAKVDEFLDSLSTSKPEDFRFDNARRQWARVNP